MTYLLIAAALLIALVILAIVAGGRDIHAGPEKAAKARARATDRLRKSVGAP